MKRFVVALCLMLVSLSAARAESFHLHLVSDSTGETLITVARAVAAQYANVTPAFCAAW
jgi:hypothetical protein